MSSQATPPSGFVHLILLSRAGEEPFYLEIPICIVTSLCLRPRKYLSYLGWCVLGTAGTLASQDGNEIMLDGELEDQGIYQYLLPGDDPLARAVDPEVIENQSPVPSESTRTRETFGAKLLERDGCCVWAAVPGACEGLLAELGILQWLQKIIDNRAGHEDEDSTSITIDDIRNGIYAEDTLHNHYFDPRKVVVLKTPNPILKTTDIPDRYYREPPPEITVNYPNDSRYTLQWLVTPLTRILERHPNNNDAMFKDLSLPKPADVLLHYNYGAAAVKHWGKNVGVLTSRPDLPRPTVPAPVPTGRSRVVHNHNLAIDERAGTTSRQGHGAGDGDRRSTSGESVEVDSEAQGGWDEDDIVLLLWSNSKEALERRAKKEQERTEYLEKWRAEVM